MSPGERLLRRAFRLFAAAHCLVYEATGGVIGGRIRHAPVLLLTATGRQSGKRRTTPLLYLENGEALVVVASNGGAPSHPAWFLNLEANPEVEVRVRHEHRAMRARQASMDERAILWPRLVAIYEPYEAYQRKTDREIPLVLLENRDLVATG